jgi:type IV pilus assembly protein PilZ
VPRRGPPPRRWRRRTASLDVGYAWSGGAVRARATTLGAGGLFVRTDAAPPEGEALRVRLRLPGSATLHEMAARVAWVLPPGAAGRHAAGMGVAFTDAAEIAALAREMEALDAGAAPESEAARG